MQIPWILIILGSHFGLSAQFGSYDACHAAQVQIEAGHMVNVTYVGCVSYGATH